MARRRHSGQYPLVRSRPAIVLAATLFTAIGCSGGGGRDDTADGPDAAGGSEAGNAAIVLPGWSGNTNGGALLGGAKIAGDASLGCVWLIGADGTRLAVLWPSGFTAQFSPLRIFDADGQLVWTEGETRDVAGGDTTEIDPVPQACRVGPTAFRASAPSD